MLKTLFLMILSVFLLNESSFSWYKGPITKPVLDSLLAEYALHWYTFQVRGCTWNTDSGKWSPTPDDVRGEMGDNYSTKPIMKAACHARIIAECGTDAQVAQTGLTRAELFRRSYLEYRYAPNSGGAGPAGISVGIKRWMSDSTLAMGDSLVARAKVTLATPRVAPLSSKWVLRPDWRRDIIFAHDQNMDYGAAANYITYAFAPQDLADPRLLANRPVSEWIKEWYGAPKGAAYKGDPYRNIHITPAYTPDFSSAHHCAVFYDYSEWGATGFTSCAYTPQLTDAIALGQPIQEHLDSPLGHAKDWGMWTLRLQAGDGLLNEPMGVRRGLARSSSGAAALAAIYRNPVAVPFLARSVEQGFAVPASVSYQRAYDWNESERFIYAYLAYRLIGFPDTALSYSEASRSLHGSYWYRYHRYMLHRTPDKYVMVGWNGHAFTKNMPGWNYQTGTALDKTKAADAFSETPGVVTQIIPDNDAMRPDNESKLTLNCTKDGRASASSSCMQGTGPGVYGQYKLVVRNDHNDATMSTTGRVCRSTNWHQGFAFYQYQTFVSFYDKTCISLMQMYRGDYNLGQTNANWTNGFGLAYHADALLSETKTLYTANGTLDLTRDSGSLGTSPWYCVNGRLGVGVKGGTGNFNVLRYTSPAPEYNGAIPGVIIGWNQTGASWSTPAGTRMANYSAAYFTDTPPEKVQYLQSVMQPLDSLLPSGWKGLVSETPDSQRVMALSRLRSDDPMASMMLTYPEGAPVFEALTHIRNNQAKADFAFDTLQTLGQTLAFYVTGETDTVVAQQVGDLMVRLKGNGLAKLVYLSRGSNNKVYLNGTMVTKTKQELKAGIDLSLTADWTLVRIENEVDDDHAGPVSEVLWPQFFPDSLCELWSDPKDGEPTDSNPPRIPEAPNTLVGDNGLDVKISVKDRSGISSVTVYLDYDSIGTITPADPYDMKEFLYFNVAKAKLGADSSFHSIYTVAYDMLGNRRESFTVPFRVGFLGGSSIENVTGRRLNALVLNGTPKNQANGVTVGTLATVGGMNKASVFLEENRTFETRIKLGGAKGFQVDGLKCQDKEGKGYYYFSLDALNAKASIYRVIGDSKSLLGEAKLKVKSNQWYSLQVKTGSGGLTGYVDGEAVLAIHD